MPSENQQEQPLKPQPADPVSIYTRQDFVTSTISPADGGTIGLIRRPALPTKLLPSHPPTPEAPIPGLAW